MEAQEILGKCIDLNNSVISEVFKSFDEDFLVIKSNNKPKWIIPLSSCCATVVLSQWRPYGLISGLKWKIIRCLYSLRLLFILPNVEKIAIKISSRLVNGIERSYLPVIYIGNPGPQQKAVATFVSVKKEMIAVMKVALAGHAMESLRHEVNALNYLKARSITGVPEVIDEDVCNGVTWQTVVPGELSDAILGKEHISWLLQLPKSSESLTLDGYKMRAAKKIEHNVELTDSQRCLLIKRVNELTGPYHITLLTVHGDFAPWNIKKIASKGIGVIDWEDSINDGFPLWDICHFYFIQDFLFEDASFTNKLRMSPLIDRYLQETGYDLHDKQLFITIYIVEILSDPRFRIDAQYKAFLFDQLIEG